MVLGYKLTDEDEEGGDFSKEFERAMRGTYSTLHENIKKYIVKEIHDFEWPWRI